MKALTGAILAIGVPANTPDILFATGFFAPDPAAYLQHGRAKILLVPGLEYERARRSVRLVEVRSLDEFRRRGRRLTWSSALKLLLKEQGVSALTVACAFPVGLARDLERAGLSLRVARSPLFPGRAVKRQDELEKIASSQAAAISAMKRALRVIGGASVNRSGELMLGSRHLTSELVRREINEELLRRDCSGAGTIVACGVQSAQPHERGTGKLLAGEGVVIDIFPRSMVHGYWGDLTRTVVKGRASSKLRKMYFAVKAAQAAALAQIKPGAASSAAHEAVCAEFERRGFKTELQPGKQQGFIHSTGHGIGLEVHEEPSLSRLPGRLKEGNVVTVEPGLYYDDVGGVRIEDVVVVTKTGWRLLGSCEKRLEI